MNPLRLYRSVLYALLLFGSFSGLYAQSAGDYPEIGRPCPDFTLQHVLYNNTSSVSLAAYRGKWLLLDFWSTGCSSCFASFPKLNGLRKMFEGKIEFLLVGYDDKYIRPSYEKYRVKQKLDLPVVYDTLLFHRFGVSGVPYVLWIDEKGIVRAITSSPEVKAENLQAMLDGQHLQLPVLENARQSEARERAVDYNKLLLINGNGGADTDFLYRSVLAAWKPGTPYQIPETIGEDRKRGRVQLSGMDLNWIYRLAYTGVYYYSPMDSLYYRYALRPVLELRDKSPFTYNADGSHLYNYSLSIPAAKATDSALQRVMQRDLANYFGYAVTMEPRAIPCYKLVATPAARKLLAASGDSFVNKSTHASIEVRNCSIRQLLYQVWKYHQDEYFLDETGISGTINFTTDVIMTDLEDIRQALHKQGLDLVQDSKKLTVIVIRDGG